jgi:transcriptional regulator of heat shock response
MEKTEHADKKHIKKLRKVLHKLKDRQKELESSLEATQDPEKQAKIRQEIDVIRLQRGKGADVYQVIKAERKARKAGRRAGADDR